MKNVIVAFSNPLFASWATSILRRGGYTIEYTCKTGGEVGRVVDFCNSMVIVGGFQFVDMTAEGLMDICEGRLAMVTVLLPHQRDLVERSDMLTIPYPVCASDLLQAVQLAEKTAARYALTDVARSGVSERPPERPAEEKLLILKAKTVLIEKYRMTESQAHRFLQKSSMDRGLKLVDAAQMVIENSLTLF